MRGRFVNVLVHTLNCIVHGGTFAYSLSFIRYNGDKLMLPFYGQFLNIVGNEVGLALYLYTIQLYTLSCTCAKPTFHALKFNVQLTAKKNLNKRNIPLGEHQKNVYV